jgi:hypothetical protein
VSTARSNRSQEEELLRERCDAFLAAKRRVRSAASAAEVGDAATLTDVLTERAAALKDARTELAAASAALLPTLERRRGGVLHAGHRYHVDRTGQVHECVAPARSWRAAPALTAGSRRARGGPRT